MLGVGALVVALLHGGLQPAEVGLDRRGVLAVLGRSRSDRWLRLIWDAMLAMKRRAPTIPRRLSAPSRKPRRTAVNTAIFSVATGLSRIAGLVREVVAARYFGTSGAARPSRLRSRCPNLVRSLFADSALSAAFVPVFSELLEHDKRRDALQLASALFGLILVVLSVITALFVPRRRADHAAVHGGSGARRPHRRPQPGAVRDRDPARPQRAAGRRPQRPRPLHDPGALPAGLEPGDHRRADRADAAVRGRRPDLRVRDRRAGRHGGPVRDGASPCSGDSASGSGSASSGGTRGSGACCCSCCRSRSGSA